MFGPSVNTLRIYIDELDSISSLATYTRTLVWQKYGSQGLKWFNIQRTINRAKPWRVVIEGVSGETDYHDIAIDDLSLSSGKCASARVCDFDFDLCDFSATKDPNSNLIWTRGLPASAPELLDHSSSSKLGSVVYAEFNGVPANSKTRLVSKAFRTDPLSECVKVWYVIKTDSVDAVELAITQSGRGNEKQIIAQKATRTNNLEWRLLQTSFVPEYSEYSIVIEARANSGSSGANLIAVDDVSIDFERCKPKYNCDFEDFDVCNWEQLKTDKFDWYLNRGKTGKILEK